MMPDAAYTADQSRSVARILHRAGRWQEAVAALPPDAHAERAGILVDRYLWQLTGAEAAEEAVRALETGDPVLAGHLYAQIRYVRLLFGLDPQADDRQRALDGFTAAASDARLAGWAVFWLGVLSDNIDDDPRAALPSFRQALAHAREQGDALLESYAVRHLGVPLLAVDREQGMAHLRWSYQLRAALGARPQTAAAAVTLAGELPPGLEADQLRESARLTARELELTWLLRAV